MLSEEIIRELDHLRRSLGMSCATVARRANVSLRTVQRVLSLKETSPAITTVAAIADALGASLKLERPDVLDSKKRQAEYKANQLVAMTQGSSALEAQAVSTETLAALRRQTVYTLLGGSPRRLWSEE